MNWRKFSRLPHGPLLAQVVAALELEIPPEGRPASRDSILRLYSAVDYDRETGAVVVVVWTRGSSRQLTDREAIRQALGLVGGTPSGKALGQWLDWWDIS